MVLAVMDSNECNFAIKFEDASLLDKVKELAREGLGAWYAAAYEGDEDDIEDEYFTKEEIEGFYWDGYAEPTEELLKRNGIEHEILDVEYDENDEVINCDEVMWYYNGKENAYENDKERVQRIPEKVCREVLERTRLHKGKDGRRLRCS